MNLVRENEIDIILLFWEKKMFYEMLLNSLYYLFCFKVKYRLFYMNNSLVVV